MSFLCYILVLPHCIFSSLVYQVVLLLFLVSLPTVYINMYYFDTCSACELIKLIKKLNLNYIVVRIHLSSST